MDDEPDITPRDALEIAQRALGKANDLESEVVDLQTKQNETRADLTALQLRISELDDDRPYDALTQDEKVGMVREELFQRGRSNGGRASMTYDNVMWSVFDGKPSADHCYKLMRLAAGYDPETGESQCTGFSFRDGSVGQKRIEVNNELAKTGVAFSSANNADGEGGQP